MSSNSEGLRLGGIAEVASELGVSRQQVAKLRDQPGFPAPIAQLAAGDFWDLDVIQRWSGSGRRRGPGRPAQGSRPVVLGRRFELIERIGGGGFAIVHSASDLLSSSDRHVAVKVLQPAHALDPEIVARFEREMDVLSRLKHPHVVRVLDNGTDPELGLWYAMELATGNLGDVVLQRPKLTEIIAIMREICAGLAYVHDEGILHRDLKPANVLRTQQGTWALADFGLARDIAQASTRLTSTGVGWGSAYYIAPEQLNNTKQVDARADVYSAGKILQALVTGLAPVDDVVPSGALRPVILKAISPDRRHRYGSAEELLCALETTTAVPTGPSETAEEKANRLRPRLRGPVSIDNDAIAELRQWAETADLEDYDEMGHLARTLSILSARTIRRWWDQDPRAFTLVFTAFAERLTGDFDFNDCDALAEFTHRAVTSTKDSQILRAAVRGLTQLGERHNRWHVQDVVLGILQAVRSKEDAAAALEGLRDAGRAATDWTVTTTARRTFHPLIRAGLAAFLEDEE